MNEDTLLSIEHRILGLASGYSGLRRFVLEEHAKATGEPMNKAVLRLGEYIDAEMDRLLAEAAAHYGPEFAARMDFRKTPPPTPPTA